jgi:hypothetical protein
MQQHRYAVQNISRARKFEDRSANNASEANTGTCATKGEHQGQAPDTPNSQTVQTVVL